MDKYLSIIVPLYNAEKFIRRCIESVLAQDCEQIELIIVNDGSTDDSEKICREYLNDSRVRLISKVNGGVSSARNKGIMEATGKYITFMDADDYATENMCQSLVAIMNREQCDMCIAGYNLDISGDVRPQKLPDSIKIKKKYTSNQFKEIFEDVYKCNYFNSTWAKCYKRELISARFIENLNLGEDLLFNLEYLTNCKNFYICDLPVYNYCYLQSESLTNQFSMKSCDSLYEVYNSCGHILKFIWGAACWPVQEIDKKYTADFIAMFERLIKTDKSGINVIRSIMGKYNLKPIFSRCSIIDMSVKSEVERIFILKDCFLLLKLFVKSILGVKIILKRRN